MDSLDKYIANTLKADVTEHPNYEHTIINSLKNIEKPRNTLNELMKKVAIVIISITTISGVVFAKQITVALKNFFETKFINDNNNSYIQILDENIKKIDGLTIKLNSIIVDDFNIQLVIEYMYENDSSLVNSDILIKDENSNLIFENNDAEGLGPFSDSYLNRPKQNYKDRGNIVGNIRNDENTPQYQFTSGYKTSYTNIENNKLIRKIELYPREDIKFPRSKKIYIQMKDFIIQNNSGTTNKINKINKECTFEIELDEKFINRGTNTYIQEEVNSKEEFSVLAAELSNMQLRLKMEYTGKENLSNMIDMKDLSSIQIFDEDNNMYINTERFYSFNNQFLYLKFNSSENKLSDKLVIIINDTIKIPITKND